MLHKKRIESEKHCSKQIFIFNIILFVIVLAYSIVIRSHFFDAPPFIIERESVTAMIAQYYYYHDNPFYLPAIGESGPNFVPCPYELPLYPYLLSKIWEITGISFFSARIFSLIVFYISALFLFLVIKKIRNRDTAFLGTICYILMPFSILFGMTIQRWVLMGLLNLIGIYLLLINEKNRLYINFIISICAAISIAMFPPNIILLIIFCYIIFSDKELKLKIMIKKGFIICFPALIFSLIWVLYATSKSMHLFGQRTIDALSIITNLINFPYIHGVFYNINLAIGLFLFAILLISLFYTIFKKKINIFHVWLLFLLLYYFTDSWPAFFNSKDHLYYYFPIVIVTAGLIGDFFGVFLQNQKSIVAKIAILSFFILIILINIMYSRFNLSEISYLYNKEKYQELFRWFKDNTDQKDYVIADNLKTLASINREGWWLQFERIDAPQNTFTDYIKNGANFVCLDSWLSRDYPETLSYLFAHFEVTFLGNYLIFNLNKRGNLVRINPYEKENRNINTITFPEGLSINDFVIRTKGNVIIFDFLIEKEDEAISKGFLIVKGFPLYHNCLTLNIGTIFMDNIKRKRVVFNFPKPKTKMATPIRLYATFKTNDEETNALPSFFITEGEFVNFRALSTKKGISIDWNDCVVYSRGYFTAFLLKNHPALSFNDFLGFSAQSKDRERVSVKIKASGLSTFDIPMNRLLNTRYTSLVYPELEMSVNGKPIIIKEVKNAINLFPSTKTIEQEIELQEGLNFILIRNINPQRVYYYFRKHRDNYLIIKDIEVKTNTFDAE